MYLDRKLATLKYLISIVDFSRLDKRDVGISHGCFDLLGPGHIDHLEWAKQQCDVLVVSLSTDEVIRLSKGKNRPILPLVERLRHVAALEVVDHVIEWPQPDASDLILKARPQLYLKGDDATKDPTEGLMREAEACVEVGCQLMYSPTDTCYHTTDLIKMIEVK